MNPDYSGLRALTLIQDSEFPGVPRDGQAIVLELVWIWGSGLSFGDFEVSGFRVRV